MKLNDIPFLLLLFLSTPFAAFAQLNIDEASFKQSIKGFENKGLIVIGEAHEIKNTYLTEFFIINHFVKKGYTTILYEGGHAEVAILNEYLETGNESILKNTKAGGKYFKVLVQKIYGLKKEYPKLHFSGVDFERSVCLEYVFTKWFSKLKNTELAQPLQPLKNIKASTKPKKIKKIILEVQNDFSKYESAFQKELGENFSTFKNIIYNPVFYADFGISSKKRDEGILQNLHAVDPSILNASILIFGSNHFTNEKHLWTDFNPQDSSFSKGLLFLFAYKNCTNFLKKKNYNSAKPLSESIQNETTTESIIKFEKQKREQKISTQSDDELIIVKLLNQ